MEQAESLVEVSSKIIDGEAADTPVRFMASGRTEQITEGVYFVPIFSNVIVVETDSSLVLVDTGPWAAAQAAASRIREVSDKPVSHAVYTHGHIDHVFGIVPLEESQGSRAVVIGHEDVGRRFDRYILTAGYNQSINRRQFSMPNLEWPLQFRYPDVTYRDEYRFEVGDEEFQVFHARGETDDHSWVWLPQRRVLCTGDLVIWCTPNAGNPQKVQRYVIEWAQALRRMAEFEAEFLLPGHGLPVAGKERVRTILADTASLLEAIHDQVVKYMNEGETLDAILAKVEFPEELLEKPYLRPVYDDPEFIVRNIWRLYGGWYDGNPANLKPPSFGRLAAELAQLCGGWQCLAGRALELSEGGDYRLAAALAELAWAAHKDPGSARVRAEVFEAFAASETSLMAKGIYGDAAREARAWISAAGKESER